jgi:hypothetical protein
MNTLKQRLLTGWHLMRMIRLILSIWIIVMAVQGGDILMGLFGVLFLYTALAGVGCCGVSDFCHTPHNNRAGTEIKDVDYKELK